MTKHLYTVSYGVLWVTKGKKPYWSDDEQMSVVANGDARQAIRLVEQKARKIRRDERRFWDVDGQEFGRLWTMRRFRVISVSRGAEVNS